MNRIFRIIWSKALRTWMVASELATSSGKGGASVDERGDAAVSPANRFAVGVWPLRMSAAAVLLALYAPAWAADRYWDSDGTGTGAGGTGVWTTAPGSLFWSNSSAPTLGPYFTWNNAALDNAIFQGTAGTVTLGVPITAHNLTFNVHNYTLDGGTLTLAGTAPTIFGHGNTVINSVVAGSNGLIKEGAGQLSLTGTNTFSGGIFLNAGALAVDDDAALGASSNVITTGTGASVTFAVGTGPVNRTVVIGSGGTVTVAGTAGQALYTGSGNLTVAADSNLTNDANTYTGRTTFNPCNGICNVSFSSIADLGVASALGAPTTVLNGTITFAPSGQFSDNITYIGDGDSSNRNWALGGSAGGRFINNGTGTLILTGDMTMNGSGLTFIPTTADMQLLGQIGGAAGAGFSPAVGRTLTLGGNNSFAGDAGISGGGTVVASVLANAGTNSSLGAGSGVGLGGTLRYTGGATSTNRNWTAAAGTLNNDGTGALTLTGGVVANGAFTLGGTFGGINTISGVISGAGGLRSNGAGTWVLNGANTNSGPITVDAGTLRAGSASAFGTAGNFTVNGGTLDLNGYDQTMTVLNGSGGNIALGSGDLTVNAGTGSSMTYSGAIGGSGSLTKLGAGTLTLKGANSYTGPTTIGGGTLALDFTGAGGPTSNIISSASTLNMGGGTLNVTGTNGEANSQTFNGLNVTAGTNTLRGTAGTTAGSSMTVNLGSITHAGGLINFVTPTSGFGFLTTSNADGTLGGWATVTTGTTTDYAQVSGGRIVAITNYTNQDNASLWLSGQFISDQGGAANTPFGNTVSGSQQLAGLKYNAAANSTVNVSAGQTLGVDGTIIVNSSVGSTSQTIQGGSVTGMLGGGTLGVQQNSNGTFTVASNVVDNGGATGFAASGGPGSTGIVSLTGANSYTGGTTVSGTTLAINSVANGGAASALGASAADSSNLLLEGGTLRYTGVDATTDRGFTLMRNGSVSNGTITVTAAATDLRFDGEVVSPDGAGLIKNGAGTLILGNGNNSYTGATTVSGGTLAVTTLANGGSNSNIGASDSGSANLVLQSGGSLDYLGGTASSDRGFTLGTGGGAIDVVQTGTTLTLSGTAVGAGTLTKDGLGTLLLSGTNTFTGGGFVNGGTLQAGSTQAFGTGGWTLASGATLDLNDFNNTVAALSGAGTVDLGSATLTINGGGGFIFNGSITGTGGVASTGQGIQIFSGCGNTYTGATTINDSLIITNCLANGGSASGIGASSAASANLVLSNNGALHYTGTSVTIDRGITLGGGWGYFGVTSGTTLGFTGAVVGPGGLVKREQGTLVLSGTNTYAGSTTIEAGILRAGSTSAFGTSGVTLSNSVGTTLDLNNLNNTVAYLQGGGAAGSNVTLGSATLTLSNGGATYAGAISGTGGLVKNGGGAQALSGCNSTYTGSTVINGGHLVADCLRDGGANSSIGASTANPSSLVINGGILRYTGTGDSTNRQFTLGTAANSYIEAYGTGAINFTSTAPITMSGNGNRTLRLGGTNTADNTLAAQINNPGTGVTSLIKYDAGTWVLNNETSTYTGATDIAGVLEVTKLSNGGTASSIGSSLSTFGNLILRNLGTLRYIGDGDSTDRLFTAVNGNVFLESSGTGAIRFTNTGAVMLSGNAPHVITLGGTYAGDNLLASQITNAGANPTSIAKNGPGTWILTGNNTHTGNTVINDGNLVIGDGGSSGNLGTGNVIVAAPTSTLSINRNDTFNFSSTISGAGGLAQIGTGTTTLTSTSNTIGAARVDAGTLQVNGVLTTSTMAINGASTLTVNGTVEGAGSTATVITGDAGGSTINVNGTLRANGDLGGGADTVNVNATLDTGALGLNLGGGDDLLTVTDGTVIMGAGIGAGAGTDTVQVDNAAALTLNGASYTDFENLIKQNAGVLTLAGNHTYSASTQVTDGTLDVDGTLTTATLALSDNTLLNVDGTVGGAGATPTALTGSAGLNTLLVNVGATLRATGDLGGGNDVVTLSGTLDTGAGTLGLGAGDDLVTLNDGAVLLGTGINAGAQTAGDVLVLNNALGLSFDGSRTAGFESLIKQSAGTATMTGAQTFTAGTAINGGALDVDGSLTTPTVTMTDGTALNVDGALQGIGGTTATITGSAGINTVSIAGTAQATGNLGAGNDVLDVAGILDTGGGNFALGDGDDTFVVHDGANVIGTVDGGAGLDSRVYNINAIASLGALVNFEGVTKTGTGTLNINGPVATDLQSVEVFGGTLNVGAAGSVIATAGSALNTVVGTGATLNVDGNYGCGAGADTMTVAGTVSGSGTIDLCGGDDTLTLQDGALLANLINGGAGGGDRVVLDNAGALSFDGSRTLSFEILQKDNTGEATLTGAATYVGGTLINGGTLTVAGSLATPTVTLADNTTLNVTGPLHGGGVETSVTGSAGVNTVTVGGTALATGNLGNGNDVLDVTGTLDTGGGTFALGDGDDSFIVHDGTNVVGIIDGGAGLDSRVYDINTVANLGALLNFEGVTKTGTGILNINGPAPTSLQDVQVLGGTLNIGAAGGVQDVQTATVGAGAALNVDSALLFTAGADNFTVSGNVTGLGTIDMLDGNDTLTLQDGADTSGLSNAIDGGAGIDTLTGDVAGTATLGAAVNFETLNKINTGTLIVAGPAPSSFSTVNALGGILDIAATGAITGVVTGTVANGATLNVDGSYTGTTGNDTLTVAGAISGSGVIGLGDGDDTLTLDDGADLSALSGLLDGGAHSGGDRVVLNNAGAMSFDAGNVVNFELLQKDNVGEATLNGIMAFTGGTVLNGGTLTVAGALTTPTVAMADGTALNVDGALQGAGGTAAVITGSVGINTVTITGTAVASGDLGAGNDVLDVVGTLDTAGGTLSLGDGDDDFVVHDGTTVIGTIDGGAGLDSRVYDITTTAEFGALLNFEGLTKRGTGTLNVSGPGATDLQSVEVEGGTLNIGAAGSIIATAGSTLNTVVASGATLNVDGSFGCGAGADTMTVAGTVSGSGTVDMCGGADTLTLQDGAVLANVVSGGADIDTVVLDNAGAMSFDGGNTINFEVLQKDNVGVATLTGVSSFTSGTVLNGGILTVAGSLTTPTVAMADDTTLNVDGALQGAGGTAAAITGGTGVNTVAVTGTALANGDLGGGNDVLDVTGTLDTGTGVFALGDGDDMLTIHDGTNIIGAVVAGAGNDTFNTDIATNADLGAVQGFETLSKTGIGTLDINGPMSSDFTTINVLAGTLNVSAAGSVTATAGSTLDTVVASGATLNVDGSFGCGAGADTMTVAGTVSGSGTVDLCGGSDTLTLQDGAVLTNIVSGGADIDTVVLDNAAAMTFDGGNTINFEVLQKDNVGVATLTGNSTYTGGALLNGGTLTVAGSLTTPTVAMADGTVLNVDGSLQGAGGAAALTGSAGVNTVNVTGTALANGDLGGGNDVLDVTGTLNTGSGVFALGDGDDMLTIHDGTNVIGTVVAGAGNDTLNTNIAANADLGAVQGFETLSKTGIGTLDINGPLSSDFATVNVLAGTLNVASGGSVVAQNSTVAAGATLQIAGSYSGTAGDDSFTSMGTVRGALGFGAGVDTARFTGGDVSGLTGLDGGAGGSDLLSFSGLDLGDSNVSAITGWERVELLNDSELTLGTTFNLGSGVLAIDATSRLFANAGASLGGNVENAGLIDVGSHRLAISGGYTSNAGALQLTVSPGTASSGGLNIQGDVVGTTRVIFDSDGSAPAAGTESIQVIASANDNLATAGGFVADDSADGLVRLEGSPFPWLFEQQADRNWYLSADDAVVLPEISGYGALSSLGALLAQQSGDLPNQRLSGVRGADQPQCDRGRDQKTSERAGTGLIDDCHGVWVAATASELELGSDPGFDLSGDDVGMYVGIDGARDHGDKTLRGGAYLGYTHGVYWASGANSGDRNMDPGRVELDAPVAGLYGSSQWSNGTYLDLVLSGQRLRADVSASDGFTNRLNGDTLSLSARLGRSYRLDNGWSLEPQLQLSASQVNWDDQIDAGGRALQFESDLVGKARAALRVEKAFTTSGGAQLRPWATLGVQNVVGEDENGLRLAQSDSTVAAQVFPGHDLGTSASLDVGLEAAVDDYVSFYGTISISQDLSGSDLEQREANMGLRIRW